MQNSFSFFVLLQLLPCHLLCPTPCFSFFVLLQVTEVDKKEMVRSFSFFVLLRAKKIYEENCVYDVLVSLCCYDIGYKRTTVEFSFSFFVLLR